MRGRGNQLPRRHPLRRVSRRIYPTWTLIRVERIEDSLSIFPSPNKEEAKSQPQVARRAVLDGAGN
jgi:hypothetical protein